MAAEWVAAYKGTPPTNFAEQQDEVIEALVLTKMFLMSSENYKQRSEPGNLRLD